MSDLAATRRHGISTIMTVDHGFAGLPGISI
jgi:predicted nucleic acid-binding protein